MAALSVYGKCRHFGEPVVGIIFCSMLLKCFWLVIPETRKRIRAFLTRSYQPSRFWGNHYLLETCTMHFFRPVFFLFLAMSLFQLPVFSQGNDGWLLKNDKDNVQVYYKKTEDVQEIKLVTSLQTTLSGLVHLLSEVENYPTWGYKVMESRLLKRISDTEMFYYTRLDFPWPLADRDLIMHTTLKQDPATHRIIATSTAVPDYVAPVPDVVRITSARTQWTLVPGNNGWVYVEYYLHSNPGGNIPDWVVNMAVDVGPRETIKSLRTLLPQTRYQAARLEFIKD